MYIVKKYKFFKKVFRKNSFKKFLMLNFVIKYKKININKNLLNIVENFWKKLDEFDVKYNI